MDYAKTSYRGDIKNGRMEGNGTYYLSDGAKYVGEFKDGMFHGKGTLLYPSGRYDAVWHEGTAVEGKFTFVDGLEYKNGEWDYCTMDDRRFHHEYTEGKKQEGKPKTDWDPEAKGRKDTSFGQQQTVASVEHSKSAPAQQVHH